MCSNKRLKHSYRLHYLWLIYYIGRHYTNTTEVEVELILGQTFKFYVYQKINTI